MQVKRNHDDSACVCYELDFRERETHVGFLLAQGLIQKSKFDGIWMYKTTQEGLNFVRYAERVLKMLSQKDSDYDQ
jgi:predicted transcriptional regulator